MPAAKRVALLAVLALAVALPWLVANPSQLNFAILVLMIAQAGVAWNILGGYAGQVSLGHAAFYGIGAYTSTKLLLAWGLSPWLGMLAGGLVAVAFALAIGWPCFRLKGHYFAMATIAIAEILQIVVTNTDAMGGAVGLQLPFANEGWAGFVFNRSKLPYYYIILALLLVTLSASRLIERSFLGYYFRAIKDEPDAARSVGIDLTRYKLAAIAASSFLTALGGSFYAQKELYIDPGSTLATSLSIKIALVAILGGVGTLSGPVVGAVILTAIEETTRTVFGGTGRGTDLIVYGLLIIVVAVFYPAGVVGGLRDLGRRWRGPGAAREPLPAEGER
ncbi:MAG TPA: branched-chain amino acid ABC transporter permease [Casimicrobiaceae bacterium]|nr:branched-chain amino acid ABC transporter permease [Casimicrobiaceae bacterium]